MTFRYFSVFPLSFVLAFAGCSGETSDVEQQSDSGSMEETVAEIVDLRNKIRDGFASGDVDAAHGPLHEVGDKLESLSKLAEKSSFREEDKQVIEEHINILFAAFGEVDKTLHGQDGSTYDEEADTIDAAMDKLVRIVKGVDDSA